MDLFNKLEALRNAQAMADVCCVPTGYIYMRGQGIKIESLIFKECMKEGQLIEVLPSQGFPDAEDLLAPDNDSEEEEETTIVSPKKTASKGFLPKKKVVEESEEEEEKPKRKAPLKKKKVTQKIT
jgi:hypothetical protein